VSTCPLVAEGGGAGWVLDQPPPEHPAHCHPCDTTTGVCPRWVPCTPATSDPTGVEFDPSLPGHWCAAREAPKDLVFGPRRQPM